MRTLRAEIHDTEIRLTHASGTGNAPELEQKTIENPSVVILSNFWGHGLGDAFFLRIQCSDDAIHEYAVRNVAVRTRTPDFILENRTEDFSTRGLGTVVQSISLTNTGVHLELPSARKLTDVNGEDSTINDASLVTLIEPLSTEKVGAKVDIRGPGRQLRRFSADSLRLDYEAADVSYKVIDKREPRTVDFKVLRPVHHATDSFGHPQEAFSVTLLPHRLNVKQRTPGGQYHISQIRNIASVSITADPLPDNGEHCLIRVETTDRKRILLSAAQTPREFHDPDNRDYTIHRVQ